MTANGNIYQAIVDNAIAAIFLATPDGTILHASKAACALFGYTETELQALGRHGIIDHNNTQLLERLEERREKGRAQAEAIGIRKNGERFSLEAFSSIFYNEAGELLSCTTIYDISDRKAAERQQESERVKREALINATDDLVWSIDTEYRLITCNKAYSEVMAGLTGKTPMQGDDVFSDDFGSAERLKWEDYYKRALGGEHFSVRQQTTSPADGQIMVTLASFHPLLNKEGQVEGVACNAKDITEYERNQAELQQTSQRLQEIMESSVDVICTISDAGIFTQMNAAAKSVFGYDPTEMIGKSFREFICAEDLAATLEAAEQVVAGQFKKTIENRYTKKDGTIVYVEWSVTWDVKNSCTYAVARDITEKKKIADQKEQEDRKRDSLINSTEDLLWSIDTNYRFLAFNRAYGRMQELLSGQHPRPGDSIFFTSYGPNDPEKWKAWYDRALSGERFTRHEALFDPRNQATVYGLVTFNPLTNDAGKVYGVACNAKDITALTENQLALQKAKSRLDTIMDFSLDMICTVNAEGIFTHVSAASKQVLGYEPHEMMGKNFAEFLHPEDLGSTTEAVEKVMAGEKRKGFENRYIRKDGTVAYLEWVATWDEQTQSRYAIARDVSDKKISAEQKALEARNREALINSTSDLIWSIDKNFRLIAANQAFIQSVFVTSGKLVKEGDDLISGLGDLPEKVRAYWKDRYNRVFGGEAIKEQFETSYNSMEPDTWLDISFNPIVINGEVDGVACFARDITESKLAEARIKESELKYRSLIEQANDAICIADANLRMIDANTAGCIMAGYTKEEVLQLSITDILFPEDIAALPVQMVDAALGQTVRTERRLRRKDGTAVPVATSSQRIADGRYLVFAHDITERKKTEENLRQSEEKFRQLFYNNPLPNFIADLDTLEILDANDAAATLYGYTRKELIQMTLPQIRPAAELPNLLAGVDAAKKVDGVFKAGIYTHCKKNGEIIKADVACHRVSYQNRNCLTLVINDVTEREETLFKLQDRDSKLETAQQIANLGYWEHNMVTEDLYWSAGVYKIWELPLDFKPNMNWMATTVHPADMVEFRETLEALHAGAEELNIEHRILMPDGRIKWVQVIGKAQRNDEGQIQHLSGTIQDITRQKNLTLSLQESKQRFEYVNKAAWDAIWDWDLTSKQTTWGEGISRVFGYNIELATSTMHFWSNNIHPEDRERVTRGVDELIAATNTDRDYWEADYRFIKADGEYAWVTDKGFLVRDKNGKAVRMVGAMQDVSKRHEADEQIRKSNERFELLGRAANDAVWEWDLVTQNGWSNLVHQELYGLTLEDPVPVRDEWIARLHPDDKERILHENEIAFTTRQKVWYGEYRLRTDNKGWISIADRIYMEYDAAGHLVRIIGSMADITVRKQEEQRLKLLESVIVNANDAVMITEAEPFDEPGPKIIFVNEAFTRLTGYEASEAVGRSPRFLQGPKSNFAALKDLRASLKNWEHCELTTLNYKKNGEEFWNQMSISPVANEKGWYTHWIAIERDVTQSKNEELQKKLLTDTSHVFNNTPELKDALEKVLPSLFEFAEISIAEVWLVSTDKRRINRVAHAAKNMTYEVFFDLSKDVVGFAHGEGLPGMVWQSKSILLWNDVETSKNFLRREAAEKAKIKGVYGVPLTYDNHVVGVLVLGFTEGSGQINRLRSIFENFGSYAGAEIVRKQSENTLNQVFNTAPDIICTIDFDGYFQRINMAGCSLLGFTEEELLSRPFFELLHPDDLERTDTEMKRLVAGQDVFQFENRYITKTGKIIWLSWSCKPTVEQKLMYAVAKDITDKKELEELLRKANTLARIGAWEVDIDNSSIIWSDITCEIHELEPGFAPSLEDGLSFYPEGKNREIIEQYVQDGITLGKPWDAELEIITAKGNRRWVRTIGEAQMVNGKCVRLNGSFQDIDARKRAEQEIKLSNERYDLVAKATSDAIWDWNVETDHVNRVNESYKTVFGYDISETTADTKFWIERVHPEDKDRFLKKIDDAFHNTNELFWQDEYRFRKQNGDYAFVNDRGYIIRNEEGKAIRMIGATQDISKLKENEIQLEKRARELAISNEELEQFAYVASHDLQEPLRMVTSFLTLIKKKYNDKLDPKGRQYIEFTVDGAMRMRRLILDLLEFSRAGRRQATLESIDTSTVVQEVRFLFRKQIQEKNATIECGPLPTVTGYQVPLRQVFQNLIGNALKYSKMGVPVSIHISATELPQHWQFAISDNGIGIAPEYFEKIFVIFQRLHHREEYSGTGLGLAVTKKIVETMGGKVWVTSEKDKGSTFYFTLAKSPVQ